MWLSAVLPPSHFFGFNINKSIITNVLCSLHTVLNIQFVLFFSPCASLKSVFVFFHTSTKSFYTVMEKQILCRKKKSVIKKCCFSKMRTSCSKYQFLAKENLKGAIFNVAVRRLEYFIKIRRLPS